ncbi:tRNA pseudouridine(55) synthase TruB [bacterium]|nr:tRNA pseudouridine(55) synthase TruB [bacterium]
MDEQVLLVDKPEGMTSYDVIRVVKRHFPKGIKIGHTGTLDPFATGLLILLLGKSTKLQDLFHTYSKTYLAIARFNISTDTLDATGKVVETDTKKISESDLAEMIEKRFVGEIEQTPPRFSAKHVNGKRAYDLARQGIEFELKSKRITVYAFKLLKYDWPMVKFEIVCSSGTYIRSLASDLANALGTQAHLTQLRRIAIGDYKVDVAHKLSEYQNEG